MSDTPETDALDCELHTPRVLQDRYSEMRDHAQKLERERDEAREELHDIRLNLGDDAEGSTLLHAVCVLQNERDEARAQVKELIYIAGRAIDLAEIDYENDKFGVVSELRSDLEKIKEETK